MRILAFSDVTSWEGYKSLIDTIKPDVITLTGDLTSDGFAIQNIMNQTVEGISDFKERKKELLDKYGIIQEQRNTTIKVDNMKFGWWEIGDKKYYIPFSSGIVNEFPELLHSLEKEIIEKYENTAEFSNIRRSVHTNKFYDFLEYARKNANVLVVKGDHDDDFEGDYSPQKINSVDRCSEISGRVVEVRGIRFLGLGFIETHYLRMLKPLIEKYARRVDVIITHCEQERVPMLSSFEPKLIIRGHFGSGKYLVNNIPAVFTSDVFYTVIEYVDGTIPKITQYVIDNNVKILEKGSCRPWLSTKSEYEMYEWLKPYNDQ
jgi:Icc-related predicted phosphoesterase